MASKAEIRTYLRQGLRDLWYPVAASWEVGSAPLGLTRLNEDIVLWRDRDGRLHAIEDRCPHRGARLSMGWNLGDRLACWYHGVEVGSDGVVGSVPAVNACPLVGQKCLRTYPVQERHGAVFVYFAAVDDGAEPPPLLLPDELEDPQYSHFLCTAAWKCGYEYAIDNVMDPMHGAYLHASSHSMAEGDRSAEMRIVPTESGFLFEKIGQKGVNFDWVEFAESGALWLRLSIPYRKQFGPGGPFWIIGMVVPTADDHCRVFFWRSRKVQGWQRDVWRFLYRARLERLHWDVLEQDRVILESMTREPRAQEYLYAHDAGLARVRRMMEKMAEKQLEAIHGRRISAVTHPTEALA